MFSAPMISFLKISIHAPARGATDHARLAILIVYISIHAPAKGATVIVVLFVYVCNISIHAPARGATLSFARLTPINSNFNPRSREGSDPFNNLRFSTTDISIHAPARGATFTRYIYPLKSCISIHAPARGATVIVVLFVYVCNISIHAPARGATQFSHLFCRALQISIHAPARGATIGKDQNLSEKKFQSTLPRGERREGQLYFIGIYNFNPRSREGSDIISQ